MATDDDRLKDASVRVYDRWNEALQKFDYFVTGSTAALCAFIAETMQFGRVALTPQTLELLGLLLLVGSVAAGFRRIQATVHVHSLGNSLAHTYEMMRSNRTAIAAGGASFIRGPLQTTVTRENLQQELDDHAISAHALVRRLDLKSNDSMFWYAWRNRLLAAGFLVVLAARIWAPYLQR